MPGKREIQQASASRNVPPFLSEYGEVLYLLKVLIFFFFPLAKFQNGHCWHQTTQQLGLVSLKLSAHDLLSEMHNATRNYRGKRMPSEQYNPYEVKEN